MCEKKKRKWDKEMLRATRASADSSSRSRSVASCLFFFFSYVDADVFISFSGSFSHCGKFLSIFLHYSGHMPSFITFRFGWPLYYYLPPLTQNIQVFGFYHISTVFFFFLILEIGVIPASRSGTKRHQESDSDSTNWASSWELN